MTLLWTLLREAFQVMVLAALMLAALVSIIRPNLPTLAGVVLLGAIAIWMRGPLFVEEAIWRARTRHRYLELEHSPWLVKVDEDETGALYRTGTVWPWWEEPLALLEVCNHTPELDGTFRTFLIRVPPTVPSARDAVAWTFGMTGNHYRPEDEA